jgi:hypothetical protein
MSEPNRTGYDESPDLSDGPVNETQQSDQDGGAPVGEDGATLTTDTEAQREDSVMRPGNEPD